MQLGERFFKYIFFKKSSSPLDLRRHRLPIYYQAHRRLDGGSPRRLTPSWQRASCCGPRSSFAVPSNVQESWTSLPKKEGKTKLLKKQKKIRCQQRAYAVQILVCVCVCVCLFTLHAGAGGAYMPLKLQKCD